MERAKYDVFLSHATPDKTVVVELARILKLQGIEPWLDVWNLIPGEPWQEAIEEALESCTTCAVCIGPSGTGPWQNEEMRAAIERRVKEKRFRVIPVLLPNSVRGEPSRLPPFLRSTSWIEFRKTLDDEKALHRLIAGIRGVQPGPGPGEAVAEGAQPYRGLEVFDVGDAPFFFGREALTEWLLEKLRPIPNSGRFLAIFGPSGSGKSSLARAGLLAAVKRGKISGSDSWLTTVFKPGDKPLEALAVHLAALAGFPPVLALLQDLAIDKRALDLNARVALSGSPADRRLLVLVDQFEEVFTLCSDEAQRTAFINNLLHAAVAADGPTLVVLTLRADFYGRCAVYSDLAPAISDRQTLVGPMNADELRSAIERPAYLAGCELEGGLTELLLKEVEPGSLPLLEYALLQIWQHREGRRLTVAAYKEIKGVTGALEKHADEVYASFTEAEGEICRRVFLRLVQVDEQERAAKRRLRLAELANGLDRQTVEAVVARLTDARLLTTESEGEDNHPTVELTHEALLSHWRRLRSWIESSREALRIRQHLDDASVDWARHGHDPSYLYTGIRLAQADQWASSQTADLNDISRSFLQESLTAQAKQRAKSSRLRRTVLIAISLLSMAALTAMVIALHQKSNAERRSQILLANSLGDRAKTVSNPTLGLLLSIEAMKQAKAAGQPHLPQAEEALRERLRNLGGVPLSTGQVRGLAVSPERRWFVTSGLDGRTLLWDLQDLKRKPRRINLLKADNQFIHELSPKAHWLLAFQSKNTLSLFNLTSEKSIEQPVLLRDEKAPIGGAFSSNGRWMATLGKGGVILRKLESLASPPLILPENAVSIDFSPDNRILATATTGGYIRLWDLSFTGRALRSRIVPNSRSRIPLFKFSADGKWLVAILDDEACAWPITDNLKPRRCLKSPCRFSYLATHSPKGSRFFFRGTATKSSCLIDINAGDILNVPEFQGQNLSEVEFNPDGAKIALGSDDGKLVLMEVAQPNAQTILANKLANPIRDISFGSDGRVLMVQAGYEPPRYWNLDRQTSELEEPTTATNYLPTNHVLAIGSSGTQVRFDSSRAGFYIWNQNGSKGNSPLSIDTRYRGEFVFGPDSRGLAWINPTVNKILVWINPAEGSYSAPITLKTPRRPMRVVLSANSEWLAVIEKDGDSLLFDLKSPEHSPWNLAPASAAVFSSDNSKLAIGGWDGSIRILNISHQQGPRPLGNLSVLSNSITALAFNPQGDLLAAGVGSEKIVLLQRSSLGNQLVLDKQGDMITALKFSHTGEWLASGSIDGVVQLWRISESPIQTKPIVLHDKSKMILDIWFEAEKGKLVSVDSDGTIQRWELRLDELFKKACLTAGRSFSRSEWREYFPDIPFQEGEPCR